MSNDVVKVSSVSSSFFNHLDEEESLLLYLLSYFCCHVSVCVLYSFLVVPWIGLWLWHILDILIYLVNAVHNDHTSSTSVSMYLPSFTNTICVLWIYFAGDIIASLTFLVDLLFLFLANWQWQIKSYLSKEKERKPYSVTVMGKYRGTNSHANLLSFLSENNRFCWKQDFYYPY